MATTTKEFDPIAHGHQTAKENAADDKGLDHAKQDQEVLDKNIESAKSLAKKNAKLDKAATNEARNVPQDIGTAERDIPEGAPVTDDPEVSKTNERKASSKDADVKKDMPDNQKRQDTDKDSATPSPDATNSPKETPADKSNTSSKTADKK